MTHEPIAVVLFQLGGPDSLAAVEPFLYNLFSDPDIIDFPFARLARPALARLISSRRARHVQEHYASIGGKSPIRELTELQARALERKLRESRGLDARVVVAMRYWHPLTEEAVEQVAHGGFRRLILLPLYPQYSKTTTGSSLNEWRRLWAGAGKNSIPISVIEDYHDHAAYLDAVVEKIDKGLAQFSPVAVDPSGDVMLSASEASAVRLGVDPTADPSARVRPQGDMRGKPRIGLASAASAKSADEVVLVFSAHGIPVRFVEAGDPYQKQIEATTRLVMERGGWPNPHVLCYQSRVNPGKWLEPSLTDTLRVIASAARSGHLQVASGGPPISSGQAPVAATCVAPRVLVVPISFVTDHVETLAEIDHEAREVARRAGIAQFELMPALNDSPAFIRALADLVLAQLNINSSD